MSRQLAKQGEIKTELLHVQKQIESLLQDKERAKKFLAASLVVTNNPALYECSPSSIVQALVGVAMLDLNIDPTMGHVYLVPYKNSVQMQVGYKGMAQLLFRAGWAVKAFPVYTCDKFTSSFDGWDNKIDFIPNIDERDESDKEWVIDNLRGIFVVSRHADTKDQYSLFISKNVLEKLRKCSPNQKNSDRPTGKFWYDWYIEMCMSKAIKKLAKQLPIGDARASMSISIDDIQETGGRIDFRSTADSGMVVIEEGNAPEPATATRTVNDIIESSAVPEEFTPEEEDKSTIIYAINTCNTLADLARYVASIPSEVKMENKELIQARQEAIKEARKAANNV